MKLLISFSLIIFLSICSGLVSGQEKTKEQRKDSTFKSDSSRFGQQVEQWQSASLVGEYMRSQGLKKIDLNTDTLFTLLDNKKKRKREVIIKYIYRTVPIYVPLADSLNYSLLDTAIDYYVDTVIKKKGIINKILHR